VRLKLSRERRSPEEMERLRAMLEARAGVVGVRVSPRTASIAVRYERDETAVGDLLGALADAGLTVRSEPARKEGAAGGTLLIKAASGMDRQLRLARNGADLRLLVPLALGALSARQALRDAPGLERAPWYVLAWYAFDSFLTLNHSPSGGTLAEQGAEPLEPGTQRSSGA
jgi:hypothetical protein